jgi:hypothetical protein
LRPKIQALLEPELFVDGDGDEHAEYGDENENDEYRKKGHTAMIILHLLDFGEAEALPLNGFFAMRNKVLVGP